MTTGQVDVGHLDGDAYEIRVHEPSGPAGGATKRNPSEVSVTMWIDRKTGKPLAVRWGEGDELWQTVEIQAFKRFEDSPANQRLLKLNASR